LIPPLLSKVGENAAARLKYLETAEIESPRIYVPGSRIAPVETATIALVVTRVGFGRAKG
jgi:hypothetical protein